MFWANVSTVKHRFFQGDQIWRGPHSLGGDYVSSGVFNKNDFIHNVWEFLHLEQKSVEADSKPNRITLQNTNMSYFHL